MKKRSQVKSKFSGVLGIDVGGTGIKGAPVDPSSGKLLSERFRLPTPKDATPLNVIDTIAKVVENFRWDGPIGCTLPAVVISGEVCTAANIDSSWLGQNATQLLKRRLGSKRNYQVLNDADAAGMAEMAFGAGSGNKGLVIVITLGTGIGSAIFYNGRLVPNSEIGHLEIDGKDAERRASNQVREMKNMSWKKWGKQLNRYLVTIEQLLWPDLIIIGGGVSKKFDSFKGQLKTRAKVVPAKLLNDAGIVGAALAATD